MLAYGPVQGWSRPLGVSIGLNPRDPDPEYCDMADLTPKQQLFCLEYIKDFNATQAAIRAGYSKKTARAQGQRLLTKVAVQNEVARHKAVITEEVQVDAKWLLKRLVDELTADIADIYDESGGLRPIREWPMAFRQGLVSGIDVETLGGGDSPVATVRKIKMSDRIRRLELIGKHVDVGAFADKLVGPDGGAIQIEDKTASDLARRLAFVLRKGGGGE